MIPRKHYIDRIRPFIDKDIVKVLTGFRRSGKSVMLELIQQELRAQGVQAAQIIAFNFESFSNASDRRRTLRGADAPHRGDGRKGLPLFRRDSGSRGMGALHQLLPRRF